MIMKKCFFTPMTFLNLLNVNSLECVSMNNQERKIKTKIIHLKTDEVIFYPYSIKINRCKGSCNTINDPNARICVSNQIKNIHLKVFNLLSRTNETRHIKGHKTCKCKCRLDASICNNNASNCDCECGKSCDIEDYLDYKNCMCRKKISDKLVEECSENIHGNELLYNETLDIISSSDNKTCDSCIVYVILFSMFLIISISMAIYVYLFLYLKNRSTNSHYFDCLNINGY